MQSDPRKGNAFYYDLDVSPLADIPFYIQHLNQSTSVLELGCGTGRALIPLAAECQEIVGIDYSADMIERCHLKMKEVRTQNASALVGDITKLNLQRKFDLVIAPYRVLQALELDQEVNGVFEVIRSHLGADGACILNVFRPLKEREEFKSTWCKPGQEVRWEKTFPDGTRVVHSEWYERMDKEKMVLFPHLIYRKYKGDQLLEEFTQKIKMRCYYPDEFKHLVESHGFKIHETWGGYAGEPYGQGKELVIKFNFP